jgi:hypothetical protein
VQAARSRAACFLLRACFEIRPVGGPGLQVRTMPCGGFCWHDGSSSMLVQLGHKLSNRMVEVTGFNQPAELPAKDFRKRQGVLKRVIQVLTINSDHRRRAESLVRSDPICREATGGYEDATTDLGVTGNAGIKHC